MEQEEAIELTVKKEKVVELIVKYRIKLPKNTDMTELGSWEPSLCFGENLEKFYFYNLKDHSYIDVKGIKEIYLTMKEI